MVFLFCGAFSWDLLGSGNTGTRSVKETRYAVTFCLIPALLGV